VGVVAERLPDEIAATGEKIACRAAIWALDVLFERDLGQYITLQDIDSLNRLLGAARHLDETPPDASAPLSRHPDSSRRIAS